jgi:hypothetical protein
MGKRETEYPHTISFRVTDEAWLCIQSVIGESGLTPHEWCRRAALERLNNSGGLFKGERLLFQHLIRAEYLITQGFQMLADNTLTSHQWKQFRANARQRASEIAEAALTNDTESGVKS